MFIVFGSKYTIIWAKAIKNYYICKNIIIYFAKFSRSNAYSLGSTYEMTECIG